MTHSVGDRGSHTPGPWRIAVGDDDALYPRTSERSLEVCCLPHSTFDAVDIYAPGDHFSEPEWGEFIANARLIAAAPTVTAEGQFLLDRLDDFENRISTDEDAREFHGHVAPAIARFRAAIQSATGEG